MKPPLPIPSTNPRTLPLATREHCRTGLRWLAAAMFVSAGVTHFVSPRIYRRIVPSMFPSPRTLVAVSGACEVAGGLGLLSKRLRRPAGWGLIALLIAVFPANLYMAVAADKFDDLNVPRWLFWLRLPLQPLMIAWVWFVSRKPVPPALSRNTSPAGDGAVSH